MDAVDAQKVWDKILAEFEDKLQFGFLEQAKAITSVQIEGEEITLVVNQQEAEDFFKSSVNENRLIVTSRPIVRLDKLIVRYEPEES